MKFKCPKKMSDVERRKAKFEIWHPYFCWLPVRISGEDCRWLETIERKCRIGAIYGTIMDVEYRDRLP